MAKESKMQKWGLVIVIVMAASMFALPFLYSGDDQPTDNTPVDQSLTDGTTFTYTTTFDANVIKELNSIRFAVSTSVLDKTSIDQAVLKVNGIANIASEFRKNDANTWLYVATATLKKNFSADEVINGIFDLSYFNGEQAAYKYVTINSPTQVLLQNTQLDLNRKFSFENATLSALVPLGTQIGDSISVDGTVKLQGNQITAAEFIQNSNNTAAPQQFTVAGAATIVSLGEKISFEGTTTETVDENTIKDALNAIDENSVVSFYQFDANKPDKTIYGKASLSKASEIQAILEENNFTHKITQEGTVALATVFVPDLEKELTLVENSFSAQLNLGHDANDEVNLAINIYAQRDSAFVIEAIEN